MPHGSQAPRPARAGGDGLESSVVVPLQRLDRIAQVALPTRLVPLFKIEGRDCLFETPKLAAVPRRLPKDRVASLSDDQAVITGRWTFCFRDIDVLTSREGREPAGAGQNPPIADIGFQVGYLSTHLSPLTST